MSDHIRLLGIEAKGIIGWFEEERSEPQRLLIDLDLETDIRAAALSDDLKDTIDFDLVVGVREVVESSGYRLVESLAQAIAEQCLKQHLVQKVTVTVTKFPKHLGGVQAQVCVTRP